MKFIVLFVLLVGLPFCYQAQDETFIFNHLSTKDGLSQNSATVFYQDKLGRMWIGTRDGLNKYDGTKITVYRKEIGNANAISNDHILSIEEDNEGHLWVGTLEGLNRYNPKTDTFTQYLYNKNAAKGITNNTIWDIKKLSDGNLWMATDNGITIYDTTKNTFYRYQYESDLIFGLRVKCILQTTANKLYLGTTTGLIEVTNKALPNLEFQNIENSTSIFIQNLTEHSDGSLLLATQNMGIMTFNPNTNNFENYLANTHLADENFNVRQLVFDANGRLWAGGYEYLLIIDNKKNITRLRPNIFDKNGLTSESLRALYKDNNNSIWIGTFYGGVNIWNSSNNNFRKIIQNTVKNNINYYVVSAIAKGGDHVFFGTEGAGINISNNKTKEYVYLTPQNSNLKGNNIKALNYSNNGRLWIGVFNHGIQVYNPQTKKFETNLLSQDLINFIKGKNIYAITSDSSNNIWLGAYGKGVIRYNTTTKVFKNFWIADANKTSLTSSLVRSLFLDSKNNVWVGTQRGLNKIDSDGNMHNYFFNKNEKSGDNILCVYEDASKNLWVSVKSKGLYKLNGDTFNSIDLIPDNTIKPSIQSILEDDQNNLWLSSNLGIIKYNTLTKDFTKYTKDDDGNLDTEFISNSSLKIGESEFYFGGALGVVYFNSNTIKSVQKASKVIITDFEIRGKETEDTNPILKTTIPYTRAINLDYNQGNFNIAFSSPNFINSKNNKYQYRLKGLEENWNGTGTPTASYTIQKAGNYIFEVKGANSDGIWNKNVTQLKITVAPAPWRTWWAYLLYTLVFCALLYLYVKILKSRAKLKHDLDIEQLEIEKTKELNKKKIQFFTNISHDFRTPLALIIGPLQQILENYGNNRTTFTKLQLIERNATHLLQLINKLMDFRKLESSIFNLEATKGNIIDLLKEVHLSFEEYAKIESKNFTFNHVEDEIMVYYDHKKLERLFYNLISNAFRYTPKNGTISLNVSKTKDSVVVTVKDSGIGIKKEHYNKVFDPYFEVDTKNVSNTNYTKGSGIGLSISKDIVELHKGKITVHSEGLNNGTEFSVYLPLGKAHLNDTSIISTSEKSNDLLQYIIASENNTYNEIELPAINNEEKATILLVEDNLELRLFLKDLLSDYYNIIEAENGEIGFNLAKSKLPDLIVSDVVMPKMTGTALCNAIKTELKTSHIPVILLTSRSSLLHKLEGLEQGAEDYLSKPFDINEFKLRIYNLLKNRELLKQKFQSGDTFNNEISMSSSPDEALYKKAVEIVKKHIGDDTFDVAYFASELGVSRTMLFTKIKAWSNYTPNEFVNHFKMKLAAQLLEQGNLNISQISYRIGFKTPRHFSKSFFKHYNETPSEYSNKFSSK